MNEFQSTLKILKNLNLQTVRSHMRKRLLCPADFIAGQEKCLRAIQKALKTNNGLLFDEAFERMCSNYDVYCIHNDLFVHDNNYRWKPAAVEA